MSAFVRFPAGIVDHFPARRSEWALAASCFLTGLILLLPGMTLDPGVSLFHTLLAIASEPVWGWALFMLGAVRLSALIVNGAFSETRFRLVSPYVRGSMAFACCFFWATVTYGLLSGARPFFALGIYPVLLALDMTNVFQSFRDAGEASAAHRRRNIVA